MGEQGQWQVRAAAWELVALSFRYPDDTLIRAVRSGEWVAAAREVAEALGCSDAFERRFSCGDARLVEDEASAADFSHRLRAEATRLFVGAPAPVVSPYEGVWRAADEGVQALLFVNPHTMEVERFMREHGFVHPSTANEPLDHLATEAELMEHLALRAAGIEAAPESRTADCPDQPGIADLSDESAAAHAQFLATHLLPWAPRFATAAAAESTSPFYRAAAAFLVAILNEAENGAEDVAVAFMGEYRNVFEELAK